MGFPPLLVIVGQTAVGKTELSLKLAKRFNGEIISADSRLFYRGMDIGTAKPSVSERQGIPHHLIDVCEPDETLTLGDYQSRVNLIIADCHSRGKLPMLVGGTGQYVKAVVEGWGIPRVVPHFDLRHELEKIEGAELGRWLQMLDPIAAEKLDARNVRRVIRALEVTLVSGVPISQLQSKTPPHWKILTIGLYREREELYARIDQRVDWMLENGLQAEVRSLLAAGYHWKLPAMSGLGYRQFQPYFDQESSLADVVERIKFETHRFSRQQNNWFSRENKTIDWIDAASENVVDAAVVNVESLLTV
ncbi:MAG: tRNA dimethylallyltransferase [Cellvibrionaceae bacterium]|jgi:tRNA dimethylallyltransferase